MRRFTVVSCLSLSLCFAPNTTQADSLLLSCDSDSLLHLLFRDSAPAIGAPLCDAPGVGNHAASQRLSGVAGTRSTSVGFWPGGINVFDLAESAGELHPVADSGTLSAGARFANKRNPQQANLTAGASRPAAAAGMGSIGTASDGIMSKFFAGAGSSMFAFRHRGGFGWLMESDWDLWMLRLHPRGPRWQPPDLPFDPPGLPFQPPAPPLGADTANVPEPATLLLLGSALASLGWVRRRRTPGSGGRNGLLTTR